MSQQAGFKSVHNFVVSGTSGGENCGWKLFDFLDVFFSFFYPNKSITKSQISHFKVSIDAFWLACSIETHNIGVKPPKLPLKPPKAP